MVAKGKAAKSATGASMSKYDVEVEARLKALEKAVADLGAKCDARAASGGGGADERVDRLIDTLNGNTHFTDGCPKGEDGVRRFS